MLRRIMRERLKRLMMLALAALIVNLIFPIYPHPVAAKAAPMAAAIVAVAPVKQLVKPAPKVISAPVKAKRVMTVRASAYSSTVDQTDSDPFTTASGKRVHPGTIAANGLPFGTKIRIPKYYGDRIFTVEDRLSSRWGNSRIDIWMTSRDAAMQWGVRTVTIEIL